MISVIMSVYNEKLEWIQKAVESILLQTYADFEYIIIIDNPQLNEDALRFLKETVQKDQRVKLHFNINNMGLMRSLNVGISLARGLYIARMDADDISFLDRFEKEISFIEKYNYDMVSANRVDINEEGEEITRTEHLKNNPKKHLPYTNFIVHPSVLIKTKVLKDLGGYRNFYNSEDYDLWLRVLSSGYKIGILSDYVIYYRIRESSMSLKNKLETYYITKYQQNLYWERLKNGMDSFSDASFKEYITKKDISSNENQKYCKYRNNMDIAIQKFKNKEIGFIFFLIKGFVAFPCIAINDFINVIHLLT